MITTKRARLMAGAIAVAGVAALTGGAFTAGGLDNAAGGSQFIGGEVSQSVTGAATLSDVAYTFTDASNTDVSSVQLTFVTITAGSAVAVEMNGSNVDTACVVDEVDENIYDCGISAVGTVSSIDVKVTEAA